MADGWNATSKVCNGATRLMWNLVTRRALTRWQVPGDDEGGLSSSLEQSWENIAVGKVRERQSFKSRAHEFCTPLVRLAAFDYPITSSHAAY